MNRKESDQRNQPAHGKTERAPKVHTPAWERIYLFPNQSFIGLFKQF